MFTIWDVRETQIETTVGHTHTPAEAARVNKRPNQGLVRVWSHWALTRCWWGGNTKPPPGKPLSTFLSRGAHPPSSSAWLLLGTDPREMKTYVHTKPVCERLLALSVIAKNWKQVKCP